MKYKEIYDEFKKVDTSNMVEQKFGISFISWAHAWNVLITKFPNSTLSFTEFTDAKGVERDVMYYPDGTAMVHCALVIEGCVRDMWLPVMDNKFKAVSNPTSRQISDTKQRCFVKCMGLFGFGLELWLGEDLPKQEEVRLATEKQMMLVNKLLHETGSDPLTEEESKSMSKQDASALIDKLDGLPKLQTEV